jgi:SAM-dependent methyltransferase
VIAWHKAATAEMMAGRLRQAGYTVQTLDAPLSDWPGPWESGPERVPLWEPSRLIAEWAEHLPQGPVLDLACGSGRDAVYLALHGHEVTGIDRLDDALRQAESLMDRHAVGIRLLRGDIERDPECWNGEWMTIHVHRFLHREALALLANRLRDGGLLLYETFLEAQALAGRKPRRARHLLKPGELYTASKGLHVIRYHEGLDVDGNWIASLVARKQQTEGRARIPAK